MRQTEIRRAENPHSHNCAARQVGTGSAGIGPASWLSRLDLRPLTQARATLKESVIPFEHSGNQLTGETLPITAAQKAAAQNVQRAAAHDPTPHARVVAG